MTDSIEQDPTPPPAIDGIVLGLHHVAIVVPSIAAARVTWEGALGLCGGEIEHVADQRVNVLVLRAGTQRIELVEPASEDSPVTRFIERSGGGLHHLAWRVGGRGRGHRGPSLPEACA